MSNDADLEFFDGDTRGPNTTLKDKLRRVAKYQRAVIFALLVNIVVNVVVTSAGELPLPAAIGLLVLILCVVVITIASIFLLARELYSIGIAVLCAVLMIVPCVALIMLLIVNQKATKFLQQNGVKVGLFGVDPARIQ